MTSTRAHWEGVYERKPPQEVSWYRAHLEMSLRFIERAGLAPTAPVIDVGGGASTLVDDLLGRGYDHVTVLDLSARAIEAAKARLGERAAAVHWLVGDVTQVELARGGYDLWHDRAVFHFLRDEADRRRYVAAVERALKPGGHLVVATFGPQGPTRCSGLEVASYDPDQLHAQFGDAFHRLDSATELHATPSGATQQFVYLHCRYLP
jgi:SAM-dependent methyltransferase